MGKEKVIFPHYVVLAIADVFAFELPVLIDDVVKTVDVRVGAETEEDVA